MSDVVGAIALSQVNRLPEVMKERQRQADLYMKLFANEMTELEIIKPEGISNWYKFIVMLLKGIDRTIVKDKMKEKGIGMQGEVYGIPLHQQPIAKDLGFDGEFHNADDVCGRHICMPLYPGLTDDQIEEIVKELCQIIKEIK